MCNRAPHVQQMLPREKKNDATCAFFLKYGYGEQRLITHRKGDFCFEVMGIKSINDSSWPWFPWLRTEIRAFIQPPTHTSHFHFVQTSTTKRQKRKLDFSKGQAKSQATGPLIPNWLKSNIPLICLFGLFKLQTGLWDVVPQHKLGGSNPSNESD